MSDAMFIELSLSILIFNVFETIYSPNLLCSKNLCNMIIIKIISHYSVSWYDFVINHPFEGKILT